MWQLFVRYRIRRELQSILKFLVEYFGAEIVKVVVYGSYLNWSFRKNSDVDVAIILRDSLMWRWSNSELQWEKRDDSPCRKDFFRKFNQFLQNLEVSRSYDIKIFTNHDLQLLEEFQRLVVHATRPNQVVQAIKRGKVIFPRGGNYAGRKKGTQELC